MSQATMKLSILLYSILGFKPLMQVQSFQEFLSLDKMNDTVYNVILVFVFIVWFFKVSLPVFSKWAQEIKKLKDNK